MHKILNAYLSEKYPRICIERENSVFECENGWFPLIDTLFDRIQQHIDSSNVVYVKCDTNKLGFVKRKRDETDVSFVSQFVVLHAKEKFGGLRIHFKGGDAYCRGLVSMTETLSYHFCEICGNGGRLNVGHTSGWIQSICKDCAKDSKRTIKFNEEINGLLKTAIQSDAKGILDFYASR